MGRSPGFNEGTKKGAWTAQEDKILSDYIKTHGEGKWINVPKQTGLRRCGKACRLRWLNYLRPDIKRGNITQDEVDLIIRLHKLLGNRWSLIAGRLPGRTDNEIKNYWNTNLAKREQRKELSVCQNGKMAIAEAEFLHDRELKPRTEDRDSNVAIVGSSCIDEQPSPVNSTEENESNFLLDFDVDVGQITFSEFMDADFTNFNMFDMNGLTQLEEGCNSESAAFSTETMATQVNWNASDKSSETPTYSSEALWSSSDCFEISSHSEQGSWCDFLDLVEECIIWD